MVRADNFRAMRILITAMLIGLPAVLSAQAQSQLPSIGVPTLADVAKKNQEARGKDGKTAKAYSNDDLKPVVGPAPPPAPASGGDTAAPATAAGGDAAAADKTQAPGTPDAEKPAAETRDRTYWSKRIAAEKARLDQDRVLAEALQSRINALNADFVNRDDPAQQNRIAADRVKATAELDRLKAAIAADQKAIAATEEEARRSGVPPGWLR